MEDWPGNIRESQNIIERSVITGQPDQIVSELQRSGGATVTPVGTRKRGDHGLLSDADICNLKLENMLEALRRANWKIYGPGGAADLLSVSRTTLISRLKKMGIYKKP